MRPDLSQIHPLKRLTLIVVRYLFGSSFVFALVTQFAWAQFVLEYPGAILYVCGLDYGIKLLHTESGLDKWDLYYDYGEITGGRGWIDESLIPEKAVNIPGLLIVTDDRDTLVIIHHLWLISINAALYLFTRWRIRRSAIRSQAYLQGSLRTSSNPPDGV